MDWFKSELFLLLLFVSSVYNEDIQSYLNGDSRHPALDFHDHTIVEPILYHGRHKRRIESTKESNGLHAEHLLIKLKISEEIFLLDLVLNKQLLSSGFFHRYQKNGTDNVHRHNSEDLDLCEYYGKVRDRPSSWAAISTCNGLDGVIYDGKELHYISSHVGNLDSKHFLYSHSNLAENNKTCGYKGKNEEEEHHHKPILRYKRDLDHSELIRGPYNANKESKYVELVLVIDNREYKELGESRQRVIQHCKTIANIINGLYSPLNIFVALVGVVIWTERDEISFSKNGDETLTNFLHYRREKLIKEHPNDNAQLLSKFSFDNGVVGKALKGPICTYEYSGGVNTDHSPVIGLVATTIAHEMGHNFGMEHDTNDCQCPDSRCIMAPSSSAEAPTHWSSCSLNYLLLAFTHGMDYCLKNKPKALFDSPVCGNGFVEPGEQCDCGLPEHCENTCCNATTCMLYANASCATGECCDLTTCMPKNAGVLCRSADYECDLPEYCTGQSEFCPPDVYKMDTEVCDNGKAYCYHGFCRTRTDQCRLLWGETGKSSDEQCYKMNTKGTRHGNCGYNKFNKSFTKCQNESVLCGMLHCRHLNERLEFGMETVAILSQSFINSKGTIIPCRNAIVDLGINQIDPGLAPDGASCGDGKMCVNQKCMSVENLRREWVTCPNDCNNNGWCNNLGHCHCKEGFAPPDCEYPGAGGSEDSGPASDPNRNQVYVQLMFIVFLGIIPAIALCAFIYYYLKRNSVYGSHMKSLPSISTSRQLKSIEDGNGGKGFLDQAKRTEDNHSLLHGDSSSPVGFQIGFFGHFKISLTPAKLDADKRKVLRPPPPIPSAPALSEINANAVNDPIRPAPVPPPSGLVQKEIEPVRIAPPPPVVSTSQLQRAAAPPNTSVPQESSSAHATQGTTAGSISTLRSNFFNKPLRAPSFKKNLIGSAFAQQSQTSSAPTLPPPNPNHSARPIISSPVLESSTSTAKELMSPPRKTPVIPVKPQIINTETSVKSRDVDTVSPTSINNTVTSTNTNTLKKPPKDNAISLNRITSFLKPNEKKPTLQHKPSQIKANKIGREQLRAMEISNPIPQSQIAGPSVPANSQAAQAVVMRSKSMRSGDVSKRPPIQTFGSMRNPNGLKRPVSIPCGARPKIPPPPRPPPFNQPQNEYADCLNQQDNLDSPLSTDNIYAVIEESPIKIPEPTNGNDSLGLLGEIVSEIKNRNFDSIYSTSTLARKKKEEEMKQKEGDRDSFSIDMENAYSNMGNMKSSASSTSSGYIQPNTQISSGYVQPSTLHKPVEVANVNEEVKEAKPESTEKKGIKKMNSKDKLPVETNNKPKQKESTTANKQTTPVNLRSRRPSPSGATNRNRLTNNSPDLVTSCNSKSNKPPDVLNRANTAQKKPTVSVKPNVNNTAKTASKVGTKPVTGRILPTKKSSDDLKADSKKVDTTSGKDSKPVVKNLPNRSNSRVAALQQKFQQ
ncbi:disintegrin and metalloproteinase domain-containing protein 12 [Coccinella septempunctata]|uniref:disintegrin and metalloproteinase domain-containing protein 12 n=1 Tax=Coccinella septempunctata TaxID=41139 RepID=UPI001D078015|nr:disintegrin and metalloproteinase domain-containing protein 12 [Coccinella septempunctata]